MLLCDAQGFVQDGVGHFSLRHERIVLAAIIRDDRNDVGFRAESGSTNRATTAANPEIVRLPAILQGP